MKAFHEHHQLDVIEGDADAAPDWSLTPAGEQYPCSTNRCVFVAAQPLTEPGRDKGSLLRTGLTQCLARIVRRYDESDETDTCGVGAVTNGLDIAFVRVDFKAPHPCFLATHLPLYTADGAATCPEGLRRLVQVMCGGTPTRRLEGDTHADSDSEDVDRARYGLAPLPRFHPALATRGVLGIGGFSTVLWVQGEHGGAMALKYQHHDSDDGDGDSEQLVARERVCLADLAAVNVLAVPRLSEWDALGAAGAGVPEEYRAKALLMTPVGVPLVNLFTARPHVEETSRGSAINLLFDQLLASLRSAHEAGWLHNDVRPANIVVVCDEREHSDDWGAWQAVLVDWGLATRRGELRLEADALGVPDFLAPAPLQVWCSRRAGVRAARSGSDVKVTLDRVDSWTPTAHDEMLALVYTFVAARYGTHTVGRIQLLAPGLGHRSGAHGVVPR